MKVFSPEDICDQPNGQMCVTWVKKIVRNNAEAMRKPSDSILALRPGT